MASGKKNYFRHSFFAIEDEKIQNVINNLGFEGYAYFFILVEVLSRQCENEFKNPIRIHPQTLRSVWRKQTKSCNKVVTKLQESGLFVATFTKSFIEFDMPKLSKYLGYYENKKEPNAPNKRKEKKRKVNIVKNPTFDFEIIAKNWVRAGGCKIGIKSLQKEIKTIDQYNLFLQAAENYKQNQIEANENFKYSMGFNKFSECWEQWVNVKTLHQEQLELEEKLLADLARVPIE